MTRPELPRLDSTVDFRVALVDQVRQFVEVLADADLDRMVPSCPEWDPRTLVGHVGQAHRDGSAVVRQRITSFEQVAPLVEVPTLDGPAACRAWLLDGAESVVTAIDQADPDEQVWNFAVDSGPAAFWPRRMTHETALHRYDAALTVGAPYELGAEIASDGVSEFLTLMTSPGAAAYRPELAQELRGTGQRLRLHATDRQIDWVIVRDPEAVTWEHDTGPADVTVQASAVDLLLLLHRRLPPTDPGLHVEGDAELLHHWYTHVTF